MLQPGLSEHPAVHLQDYLLWEHDKYKLVRIQVVLISINIISDNLRFRV